MGECPDWYAHLQAAKYMEVAPWTLLMAPAGPYWKAKVFKAMEAEAEAREIIRSRR